jgi:two-component system response regulator RstA
MIHNVKPASILLLQSDVNSAKLTADYLGDFALQVDIETDEILAFSKIRRQKPDLVILDGMLSGRDVVDVCRELRRFFTGALMLLTMRGEAVDEILGLEMGADDYLQKPLQPRLLAARVKALLRRSQRLMLHQKVAKEHDNRCYKFAYVEINDSARRVKSKGVEVDLTTPQYELLLLLAKNSGKILSREHIFQSLRGIEYDGINRFADITVSQIRAQINDPQAPLIKTVRGQGYLLVPEPM